MPKTPVYRKRADRDQALVTLTNAASKRRKGLLAREYGSAPAARCLTASSRRGRPTDGAGHRRRRATFTRSRARAKIVIYEPDPLRRRCSTSAAERRGAPGSRRPQRRLLEDITHRVYGQAVLGLNRL